MASLTMPYNSDYSTAPTSSRADDEEDPNAPPKPYSSASTGPSAANAPNSANGGPAPYTPAPDPNVGTPDPNLTMNNGGVGDSPVTPQPMTQEPLNYGGVGDSPTNPTTPPLPGGGTGGGLTGNGPTPTGPTPYVPPGPPQQVMPPGPSTPTVPTANDPLAFSGGNVNGVTPPVIVPPGPPPVGTVGTGGGTGATGPAAYAIPAGADSTRIEATMQDPNNPNNYLLESYNGQPPLSIPKGFGNMDTATNTYAQDQASQAAYAAQQRNIAQQGQQSFSDAIAPVVKALGTASGVGQNGATGQVTWGGMTFDPATQTFGGGANGQSMTLDQAKAAIAAQQQATGANANVQLQQDALPAASTITDPAVTGRQGTDAQGNKGTWGADGLFHPTMDSKGNVISGALAAPETLDSMSPVNNNTNPETPTPPAGPTTPTGSGGPPIPPGPPPVGTVGTGVTGGGTTGIVPPSGANGVTSNIPAANASQPATTSTPNDVLSQLLTGTSGQGAGSAVSNATQQAELAQLANPNPYLNPAVQAQEKAGEATLAEQAKAAQQQLDEEMARRGVGSSSIAGGYYGDLAGQEATAQAGLQSNILSNMANLQLAGTGQAINQGQAGATSAQNNQQNWLSQLMGYGQNAFNNDVTTNTVNQNSANNYQNLLLQMLLGGYSGGTTA